MRISERFSGSPGAIAAARRTTVAFLHHAAAGGAAVADHTVHGAVLVVSELVTNAVKYAHGPCGVDLTVLGDAMEITVWDTSATTPTPRAPNPARIGQHGLEVVMALCEGFTVTTTPRGKQITVRMPLDPASG